MMNQLCLTTATTRDFRWGVWFIIAFIGLLQLRNTGNNNSSRIYMLYNWSSQSAMSSPVTVPQLSYTTITFLRKLILDWIWTLATLSTYIFSAQTTHKTQFFVGESLVKHKKHSPLLHRVAIAKQWPLFTKLLLGGGWYIVTCLAVVA